MVDARPCRDIGGGATSRPILTVRNVHVAPSFLKKIAANQFGGPPPAEIQKEVVFTPGNRAECWPFTAGDKNNEISTRASVGWWETRHVWVGPTDGANMWIVKDSKVVVEITAS